MLNRYKSFCHSVLRWMDKKGFDKASRALVTLLMEPIAAFKSAYFLKQNQGFEHFSGRGRVSLFIHGNHHNPSAWIEWVSLFQKNGASFFTVNLPSGAITEEDLELVEAKIQEIREKVGDVPIDFIGHSRGANVAFLAALDRDSFSIDEQGRVRFASELKFRPNLGKLVGIAHPYQKVLIEGLREEDRKKIFEVVAHRDVLVMDKSFMPKEQVYFSKAGHVGVLYDKDVMEWITSQ